MDPGAEKDVEAVVPPRIPWSKMVLDQAVITDEIRDWPYRGKGTQEEPFIVEWIDHDPRNPMEFPEWSKWALTLLVAIATLAVAFVSSAYSGGVAEIAMQFGSSEEINILGVSLFVLGFAIGPLLWAPMSELYGRQYLFVGTYAALTAFNAGAAGSQNIATLIILRFLAGSFGSSPLTNAGGVIADMFTANQRGLATTLFAAAPFLGPTLGPIVGGFVGETIGWRWIEGVMAIFTGIVCIIGTIFIPETYSPVLLRKRAQRLSKLTGKVYLSRVDAEQGTVSAGHAFKTALGRPWILLFREPIVLLLSIYMAIVYGTLYMMFAAFPIVFQETRGWSPGIGGLAFLGVMVGMMIAVAASIWDNKRYVRVANKSPGGFATPEARLPPCAVGGIALPIGLFWFAWTNYPSIHWIVPIIASAPFGFGMVLVFLGIMNYLIDAYVIFAASVLAANSVLRSLFGFAFPLFTTQMYDNLGIHWASSIPAFLALMCVPFPFIFYKYGPAIRIRCKYAAEADAFLKKMRGETSTEEDDEDSSLDNSDSPAKHPAAETDKEGRREREEEREAEAYDYSYDDKWEKHETAAAHRTNSRGSEVSDEHESQFATMKAPDEQSNQLGLKMSKSKSSMKSALSTASGHYEGNPYDLDRVNTKDSFRPSRSAKASVSSAPGKGSVLQSQSG